MEINKYEKKLFSQNGEDGVIDYIFSNIGMTNKIFVEFGFGMNENNSRNLIENHGFGGLFIDSTIPINYRNKTINNINYHQAWITRNNIKPLRLTKNQFISRSNVKKVKMTAYCRFSSLFRH